MTHNDPCQVQQVANAAQDRGDSDALFPVQHPMRRLVRGSYSAVCDALSGYDLNLLFNQTSDQDDPRSAFRKDYAELLGPGMNLIMPTAAAYMCYPGRNRVFLPAAIDRTLVQYLQQVGFLGEVLYHDGLPEMLAELKRSGRRVYSIDDLGDGADQWTANTQQNMVLGNSKEMVPSLSAFAAKEQHKDMFQVDEADYHQLCEPGRLLYLKTCNTENAGEGVFPVASVEQFTETLEQIRQRTRAYGLNHTLVLQPEILGQNKSFQIYIDPTTPQRIQVVALTDQLIGDDGIKYAGSVNHVVTRQRLEVVGDAIMDLADRLQQHCPGATGFVMCDYFEQDDGRIVTFDPGLRPSSNTAAAMVKLWIEEASGQSAAVANSPWFDLRRPGLTYDTVVQRLGQYADPGFIARNRLGVLPRGHNQIQGKSRLIIVTPTTADYEPFRQELEQRLVKD